MVSERVRVAGFGVDPWTKLLLVVVLLFGVAAAPSLRRAASAASPVDARRGAVARLMNRADRLRGLRASVVGVQLTLIAEARAALEVPPRGGDPFVEVERAIEEASVALREARAACASSIDVPAALEPVETSLRAYVDAVRAGAPPALQSRNLARLVAEVARLDVLRAAVVDTIWPLSDEALASALFLESQE